MQPTISREAVTFDRRQPSLRWSAVFAGAASSVGLWMLLQLLGMGIGLAAIDVDDAGSLRGVGIGTTVWSLVAPLIAMFFGGMVTGRLAQTYDRRLAGTHGLVMWAITAVVGLCATVWIVTMIAASIPRGAGFRGGPMPPFADRMGRAGVMDPLGVDVDALVPAVNQRRAAEGKPAITALELRAAIHGVARDAIRTGLDRDRLIDQLAEHTQLSRTEAADVARQIEAHRGTMGMGMGMGMPGGGMGPGGMPPGAVGPGGEAPGMGPRGTDPRAARYPLDAADATGKALATVGLSLLLSLVTSIGGAMLALRRARRDAGGPQRVGPSGPGGGDIAPAPPVTMPPDSLAQTLTGPRTPPPPDLTRP